MDIEGLGSFFCKKSFDYFMIMMFIISVWSSQYFLGNKSFFSLENIPKSFSKVNKEDSVANFDLFYQFNNTARKRANQLNLLQMHTYFIMERMHKVSDAIIVCMTTLIHLNIFSLPFVCTCHHLQFKCKIARGLQSKKKSISNANRKLAFQMQTFVVL